ncbi:hypothetical protein ACQPZG_31995 [Streptomyces sp. CA-294286]|uniref:hypothetical protein n=1 Tax=Streptomyces sp. CA-294286 TaxID=3240070 RepID=UPI003D904E35
MHHRHEQIPIALGPSDRMSVHGQQQLGVVLGAVGAGCTGCAESALDAVAADPAAVGRLVEITRRTAALLHDGGLPDHMTSRATVGELSGEFRFLVCAITEAADPAATAAQMAVAQRRTAARTAALVLAEYNGDAYANARDSVLSGGQTLSEACLAHAEQMTTWWQRKNSRQAAAARAGWQQACEAEGLQGHELLGERGTVFVLGAVLHRLAREAGTTTDTIHTLPYTRILPLLRDPRTVVRTVREFVTPPALEITGMSVKRLACDSPTFAVLGLWTEIICRAHAEDCTRHGPGHECTLADRAALLTPRTDAA